MLSKMKMKCHFYRDELFPCKREKSKNNML